MPNFGLSLRGKKGGVAVTAVEPPDTSRVNPNDFTYDGAFAVPVSTEWAFNHGTLTHRYVDGVFHLLMSGAESNVERVFEFTVPSLAYPPATLTRLTPIYAWGDVSDGNLLAEGDKQYIRGIKWLEDEQVLVWNYTIYYGTETTPGNPSIGQSELDNDTVTVTAYGPWRAGDGGTQEGFIFGVGCMLDVPSWFQAAASVGKLACFASQFSQVAFEGAQLHAFALPAKATPRDTPVNWFPPEQNTHITIDLTTLLNYPLAHCQPKPVEDGGVFSCSGGASLTPDTATLLPPVFGGGAAHAAEAVDTWQTGVWIDTGTKRGVLSFGAQQRSGHNWYGNYARTEPEQPPTGTCWHDLTLQTQYSGGIGPSCTEGGGINGIAFYDPLDLLLVANGDIESWEVVPYHFISADEFANNSEFIPRIARGLNSTINVFGNGCTFDSVTKKLYLIQTSFEYTDFQELPCIHVFTLND